VLLSRSARLHRRDVNQRISLSKGRDFCCGTNPEISLLNQWPRVLIVIRQMESRFRKPNMLNVEVLYMNFIRGVVESREPTNLGQSSDHARNMLQDLTRSQKKRCREILSRFSSPQSLQESNLSKPRDCPPSISDLAHL
jgi:hypothetical protein